MKNSDGNEEIDYSKLMNKGLSEETLAFLGNDFDEVRDRKFLMDSVSIVLGTELAIQVKRASKTKKITELNIIRLAVKKYLGGDE